jgi:predicted nucleic-acid-binding Zn-ribbon protein
MEPMDKNKPTKCAKKNFLEKTAFLTRKIFKKSMETEKKNQMYLSCFKIFFLVMPKPSFS